MRSKDEDRTTRAIIREESLRLFAEHGPDAVTMRQIAAAAGVSPGLVMHHFGSKEGLREAVDQHVFNAFEAMLDALTAGPAPDPRDAAATGSLVEALMRHLPPGSPLPAYLRRLLLAGGEPGRRLMRRIYEASSAGLRAMVAAGKAAPGRDPAMRAAILMANDLAVLLLHDQLTDVLGVDPLTTEGMGRWTSESLAIYASGLLPVPEEHEA
ncbi:TetR family transcriptional regulator [Saccharopolyspora sp. NPDC050389]|uniref:TetR/AcrR family transcriptional regulator n=1 Tax=Saccharopolyspora sp. NPDC050389 TaxID=3155516 RepID=UPI0033FAB15E